MSKVIITTSAVTHRPDQVQSVAPIRSRSIWQRNANVNAATAANPAISPSPIGRNGC